MGNQPLTVGLKVQSKGPHTAGSIVYGRVYLSVSKKAQAARSIQLRITGKENLVIHHTSQQEHRRNHGGSRSTTHHHHHHHAGAEEDHYEHSTHEFLQMDYPLHVFPNGKIPVGQYEYPFALQLPESLPSTMTCQKGRSSAEVKYEIQVEINQDSGSMFHSNPSAVKELVVEAATSVSPGHDTSLALPVEIVPITSCCCSKKGTMTLETQFDKTTLSVISEQARRNTIDSQDNAISVQFRCQNKSTVGVNKVRVKLQETIEWSSRGYHERMETVLTKIDLDAAQFPELDKLRHKPRRRRQGDYFGVAGGRTNDEQHMLLHDLPWHSSGQLQVPRHAKDTYEGRALQVRHVLTVELVTEGCCNTSPDASTLVRIYRRLATEAPTKVAMEHESEHCSVACAPVEDGLSMAPSAPSDFYDENDVSNNIHLQSTAPTDMYYAEATATPVVEAQALPADWNAQTAQVVNIPMAEAIVLGTPSAPFC